MVVVAHNPVTIRRETHASDRLFVPPQNAKGAPVQLLEGVEYQVSIHADDRPSPRRIHIRAQPGPQFQHRWAGVAQEPFLAAVQRPGFPSRPLLRDELARYQAALFAAEVWERHLGDVEGSEKSSLRDGPQSHRGVQATGD